MEHLPRDRSHFPDRREAERIAASVVARFAQNWQNPVADMRDLYQEARVAAWEAEQSYDAGSGASLSTHIYHRARFAVMNAMNGANPWGRRGRIAEQQDGASLPAVLSLDALREETSGDDLPVLDLPDIDSVDPEEEALVDERRRRIREVVERLPGTEARAAWMHWAEGRPITEVAAALGCSRQGVYNLLKRARRRLRAALAAEGLVKPNERRDRCRRR